MDNNKVKILNIVFFVIFGVLFFRLLQLQIFDGATYREMSDENAAKIVLSPAPRGFIFDRNGKIMVENRPVFVIQVLPQLLATKDKEKKERILNKLGQILGEEIRFKATADKPIIVKDNISPEIAIKIEEQKNELEGVIVAVRPVRYYPYGSAAAHLLGYVGEIGSSDLINMKDQGYRSGDLIGKDGIEKVYDKYLRGIDGGKKIEVDVRGAPVRLLASVDPVPGANIRLTIDLDLQLAAEKALGANAGAVVVVDPKNGEILAMASHPNYDPNIFINAMDNEKMNALNAKRHPFMNRALAIYPPGSIFKVITLTAAIQENVFKKNETFYCPGYYRLNNRIARCWNENGHRTINAQEGLTQSCDIVFYELGRRLGPDRLAKYAVAFGLGERTGIDLPQEKRGLIPTTAWKKERFGQEWYEGESINYGIGQGYTQVTPIQMAMVYSTIASGDRMKPFIVQEIKDRSGKILYQGKVEKVAGSPAVQATLEILRKALFDVVDRATGRAAKVEGLPAAGKTGTAENPGLPHAWFLCYAPFNDPKIAISSFVEHGSHGDRSSAYVARDILIWYKAHRIDPSAEAQSATEESSD
ncbi:MAG: penicillin-binding protein 2 [Candidatus Margulisiibacteriota bacterium]